MRRMRIWLPAIYLLIALGAWIDFARLPPDGLASLGLWLVVFPIAILDILLRPSESSGSSILMPDGHGYYGDHAIFFSLSVLTLAIMLYAIGAAIDRRRSR